MHLLDTNILNESEHIGLEDVLIAASAVANVESRMGAVALDDRE
jgi:hypothetical protein